MMSFLLDPLSLGSITNPRTYFTLLPNVVVKLSKSDVLISLISVLTVSLSQDAHWTWNLQVFLLGRGYSESGTTSTSEPEKIELIKSWSASISGCSWCTLRVVGRIALKIAARLDLKCSLLNLAAAFSATSSANLD